MYSTITGVFLRFAKEVPRVLSLHTWMLFTKECIRMKGFRICFYALLPALLLYGITSLGASKATLITSVIQQQLTPDQMLKRLIEGNRRFIEYRPLPRDLIKKAELTAKGQYPGAVILSCIDSRIPPEIVFNQDVGNIFVTRIAANVLDSDVLGGLEFATKVSGARLIVVMGHDACGAVKGACQEVKLGYLTALLAKIQPAIEQATKRLGKKDCDSEKFINLAAENNVRNVVKKIPQESSVIHNLIKAGQVKVVGAMYHLRTGKVEFLTPSH